MTCPGFESLTSQTNFKDNVFSNLGAQETVDKMADVNIYEMANRAEHVVGGEIEWGLV